jgi:hypothetical protein
MRAFSRAWPNRKLRDYAHGEEKPQVFPTKTAGTT